MGLPFVPLGAGEPVGASAKSAPAQAQRLARPGIYLVRVPKPDFDETALQAKQAQFQAIQEKLRQGNSGQEGKASNRSKRDAVLVGAGVCVGAQGVGGRGRGSANGRARSQLRGRRRKARAHLQGHAHSMTGQADAGTSCPPSSTTREHGDAFLRARSLEHAVCAHEHACMYARTCTCIDANAHARTHAWARTHGPKRAHAHPTLYTTRRPRSGRCASAWTRPRG